MKTSCRRVIHNVTGHRFRLVRLGHLYVLVPAIIVTRNDSLWVCLLEILRLVLLFIRQ